MSILSARLPFRWPSTTVNPEAQIRALRQGLQLPASGRGGRFCLLNRALYRVRLFDLHAVPARERRAVLRNLLLAWSPFDQSDFRVVLKGEQALAFAWDAQQMQDWFAAAGIKPLVGLPEGLLRPPMDTDGMRWVNCLEGVELQVWRSGLMQASRWWALRPGPDELQGFLRGLGKLGAGDVLTQGEMAWLAKPWAEALSMEVLASNWSRMEQLATGVALLGLTALSAAQARGLYAAYEERQALVQALESAKLAAAPVLVARDRALTQARELDGLARQLTAPQPLEVMQHLAGLLPAQGVVLKELELNGMKLRLGLELAPTVARSALVKDLQAGAWFTGVSELRETSGRNWVTFEMSLSGTWPPAGKPSITREAVALKPS